MTSTRFSPGRLIKSLATVLVVGCASETLEVNYDSYAVAVEAGSLQRGWLPLWLPAASTRIFERHNLDTNARMWAAEVPVGTEVVLPSSCASASAQGLPRPPFERHWWPEGVPHGGVPGQEFMYFKCGAEYVGLAAAGGKLVGWAVQ
jgi:hypothetical protein